MEAIASPAYVRRPGPADPVRLNQLIRNYQPRVLHLGVLLSYFGIAALLALGWLNRDRQPFNAETGVGYYLGIIGGSMMLLLLVYPLRKRIKALRVLGPIAWSFRLHMMLGILGPTLILFHSGFSWGSTNSNVALVCMLVVASSGLIGRYVYKRIHHGLYGSKTSLAELTAHSAILAESLTERLAQLPALLQRLQQLETHVREEPRHLLQSLWRYLSIGPRNWLTHIRLRRDIQRAVASLPGGEARELQHQLLAHARAYLENSRKIAEFTFYERLFALWHLFHLPLFIMLVISGFVHVFAVHVY